MKEKIKKENFIHNNNSIISNNIREIVFGMEDGIVSTLGALTGIAIATENHFTIIVSGLVIISVESISMGVGSYLSNKSVAEIEKRKIYEESIELEDDIEKEKHELFHIFCKDGWPSTLAGKMAKVASKNKTLMLKEMTYRELGIAPRKNQNNLFNGFAMFLSYVIGGIIPLYSYFLFPISSALYFSILSAMLGLFLLGMATSKFTNINCWKNGIRILSLGALSAIIGLLIGQLANHFK